MEFLNTKNAPSAIGPYSQAVKVNGLLYTSGQIALTPEGKMISNDIKKQTRQVLSNLKAILEDNESSIDNVVKVNIFLENMDDFGIVNVLYSEFFGDHKPVRSTVAVQTLPKNALVEMDLIATMSDYH
ncbi:MAG: RidA family protein [Campylobacteraceae bacterium]|jgi:2-iminobutanoate/2-iminopropanoate deaminase|nr:RidA family protein [Campylobacteraceae bacterium]MBT3882011.1 RidA family protein [Campylobacteraceae bacterium]MBT4029987.1 RidA family protein [Campylobacteraceae bacterium]MBT4179947.1 RidA family protein [Campylobacteraceae bacterium]MBT4572251.1 RidA family protein [Campylobacteraceae bacterium]